MSNYELELIVLAILAIAVPIALFGVTEVVRTVADWWHERKYDKL